MSESEIRLLISTPGDLWTLRYVSFLCSGIVGFRGILYMSRNLGKYDRASIQANIGDVSVHSGILFSGDLPKSRITE